MKIKNQKSKIKNSPIPFLYPVLKIKNQKSKIKNLPIPFLYPVLKIKNQKSKIKNSLASFTLVELMVVLAIIAMLAGLILYGVGRTRAKAVMVKCQNNLREHGVALGEMMLAQEGSGSSASGFGQGSYVALEDDIMLTYLKGADGEYRPRPVTKGELSDAGIKGISHRGGASLTSADHLYGDYLDFNIPANVRHCPALPDYKELINTNSRLFKGYGLSVVSEATWGKSLFDAGGITKSNIITDVCISVTTYALNTADMSPPSVAYIDWNAAEGWGTNSWAFGYHGNLYLPWWQFDNAAKDIVRGESKGTTNWWHTEVGFHHLGGANYITWGGQGGWVHSNDINLGYFKK